MVLDRRRIAEALPQAARTCHLPVNDEDRRQTTAQPALKKKLCVPEGDKKMAAPLPQDLPIHPVHPSVARDGGEIQSPRSLTTRTSR